MPRIFKFGNIQNAIYLPDKELKILIYGIPFSFYRSYTFSKIVWLFRPPCTRMWSVWSFQCAVVTVFPMYLIKTQNTCSLCVQMAEWSHSDIGRNSWNCMKMSTFLDIKRAAIRAWQQASQQVYVVVLYYCTCQLQWECSGIAVGLLHYQSSISYLSVVVFVVSC